MKNYSILLATAGILAGGVSSPYAFSAPVSAAFKPWTVEALATIPMVLEVSIASDGGSATYISYQSDLALNSKVATLHCVDLKTGRDQILASGPWMEALSRNEATASWSVLADVGEGVQLYEAVSGKPLKLVLKNPDTVVVGRQDGAFPGLPTAAPKTVGIATYAWSPDHKTLWYSRMKAVPWKPTIRFNEDIVTNSWNSRRTASAAIEYHAVTSDGKDTLVDTRPPTDYVANFYNGLSEWRGGVMQYVTSEQSADGESVYTTFQWNPATGVKRQLGGTSLNPYGQAQKASARGPYGGALASEGFGKEREIKETGPNGLTHSYGKFAFGLTDSERGPGRWLSSDGSVAVSGIRTLLHPSYGLAVLAKDGLKTIQPEGSLTKCDFTPTLENGVCVHEGANISPELVQVNTKTRKLKTILSLAPKQAAIAPLSIEFRTCVNRNGHYSTGYLMYPRHYVSGQRYPAIFIIHGSDSDERFPNQDTQWEYPGQVFAEQGYLVVMINDPSAMQTPEMWHAFEAWNGLATMEPQKIQDTVWLEGVYSLEDALSDMVKEGLINPEQVGIAGFSRGSQMTNVVMTQSRAFKVASSGDGGYLEPNNYQWSPGSYRRVFGGAPYEAPAIANYQRLSPSYRADKVAGPLLQQVVGTMLSQVDLYQSLTTAKVPTQLTLYPGETEGSEETHVFHIPSNQIAAMNENLDWFNFWLLGKQDPDPAKRAQYVRWEALRNPNSPVTSAGPGK